MNRNVSTTVTTASAFACALVVAAGMTACGQAGEALDREDESWITIRGTVSDVQDDEFTLDYGDGSIVVEFDDGDDDADARRLVEGDTVSITGVVDDDFFEAATIEAGAVHVDRLDMTFRASTIDDEDLPPMSLPGRHVVSQAFVQGTVTGIADNTFTLGEGKQAITVSVEELDYDPLDDEEPRRLQIGDRVIVVGANAHGSFVGPRLFANRIILFRPAASPS